MTEREALIAGVIQNPDADTPRLVFADWCDDNGEPERSRFIRVQCELARMNDSLFWKGCKSVTGSCRDAKCPCVPQHERYRELDKAQYEVWSCIDERYKVEGIPYVLMEWYVRGFVERLTLDWPTFRDHADTLTKSHPIREVTLTTMPQYVAQGNRYVMIAEMDSGDWEYRWETTEGYDELCRMFKDWLAGHWPRITFNLPPEPGTVGWNTVPHATPLADLQRFQAIVRTASQEPFFLDPSTIANMVGVELRDVIRALQDAAASNPVSSPRSDPSPPA